jgi:alpha-beta hydrolase superfamily lysophospholipase
MPVKARGPVLVGIAILLSLLVLLCRPFDPDSPRPGPDPARGYAEAASRWAMFKGRDGAEIHPACASRDGLHGRPTPVVVVLFHGLASCPRQCARLADSLYARGCNVIVPRAPYHGYADRMTVEQSRLTARELAVHTDECVDIARGLGDTVVLAGLSTGAVQAAWAAQLRPDVRRAVLVCPVFGVGPVHPLLTTGLVRSLVTLPNGFLWWDPRVKERLAGPVETYPRYSTRALGEVLRFGLVVQAAARRRRPMAPEITVVTSGSDLAVSNAVTAEVVRQWRRHGQVVRTFEFPRGMGVGHDVFDPEQPYAKPGLTYPRLIAAILGR